MVAIGNTNRPGSLNMDSIHYSFLHVTGYYRVENHCIERDFWQGSCIACKEMLIIFHCDFVSTYMIRFFAWESVDVFLHASVAAVKMQNFHIVFTVFLVSGFLTLAAYALLDTLCCVSGSRVNKPLLCA